MALLDFVVFGDVAFSEVLYDLVEFVYLLSELDDFISEFPYLCLKLSYFPFLPLVAYLLLLDFSHKLNLLRA